MQEKAADRDGLRFVLICGCSVRLLCLAANCYIIMYSRGSLIFAPGRNHVTQRFTSHRTWPYCSIIERHFTHKRFFKIPAGHVYYTQRTGI